MNLLIVLPCLNEEEVLEKSVLILRRYLIDNLEEYFWRIVIADNNSSDRTSQIGKNLSIQYSRVYYFHLTTIGKGLAVLSAWQRFDSDIYIFMDVDLSTDLRALKPLVEIIDKEKYDIAVGSRFARGASVKRTFLRKLFSFGYLVLLKIFFQLKVKDAPCGFKAVNKKVVQKIVPKIKNRNWFFDTEMLVLAQRHGYKIKEVPVAWEDKERESRVKLLSLSWSYFKEVLRLFFDI